MNKVLHKRSSVITDGNPKLPSSEMLDYGELAINYADGAEVITLKNTSNEIVEFRSKEYVDEKITETVQHCDSKVFIGTQEEYDIACTEGKVAVGALVIILDENETNSDATTAMLGKAIIGTLLLGRA